MKNKQIKWIGAAALSLVLMAVAAPSAFTEPAAPTLTASVVSQQCQGGDDVNVVLTAVLSPNRTGVLYAWDLDNDGALRLCRTPTQRSPPSIPTRWLDRIRGRDEERPRQANRLDHLPDPALP